MTKIVNFLLISSILLTSPAFAGGKIVKWVDGNGKTHYGDKPPMPTITKKTKILNKDGVIVRSVDQSQKKNATLDKARAEQTRKDAALLASYNTADEIDIAKERNTKLDRNAVISLNKKLASLEIKSEEAEEKISALLDENKKISNEVIAHKISIDHDIKDTKTQIVKKEQDIKTTEERYDADKVRYLALKPNNHQLKGIRDKEQAIVQLSIWKRQAKERVEFYSNEAVRYKRAGNPVPSSVKDGLLQATEEVDRASNEIKVAEDAIKRNQRAFSQVKTSKKSK